jgi:hypothetical protein
MEPWRVPATRADKGGPFPCFILFQMAAAP